MRTLLIVVAALLLSGCPGHSRWDGMIDSECERLMRGDALDQASARRLGCYVDG